MASFECSVVTPEGTYLECQATSVVFPAFDGERGVLPHHAPMVCRLGIGVLQVRAVDGNHRVYVDGGVAQMVNNRLSLLTEQARALETLEPDAAQRILDQARALKVVDEASYRRRQAALERGRVQQRLTSGR